MPSKLNPAQLLILISHTSPLKFELFCGRNLRLVFVNGDQTEDVAICDAEALSDVQSGIADMGYGLIDEWRVRGESGYLYAKQ